MITSHAGHGQNWNGLGGTAHTLGAVRHHGILTDDKRPAKQDHSS